MIVTISGASGAGKTTIAGWLLRLLPNSGMVPSHTTRSSRPSDIGGEYIHISKFIFWLFNIFRFFIWTVHPYGHNYGTAKRSVNKALRDNTCFGIMLLFDTVDKLRSYARKRGEENQVISFYIISPPIEVLRERLIGRGENPESVERRLSDCQRQDEEAIKSDIPYIFVRNDEEIDLVVAHVMKRILAHKDNLLAGRLS